MATSGRGTATSRDERGTALVEFTFVALILFALLFGIISYSYMMSFRQAMTQAAAEAARAGALASPNDTDAERQGLARDAVDQALSGYESGGAPLACGQAGLQCIFDDPAECPPPSAEVMCITVRYPYSSRPLLPSFPGLDLTLPDTLEFTSVVEIG